MNDVFRCVWREKKTWYNATNIDIQMMSNILLCSRRRRKQQISYFRNWFFLNLQCIDNRPFFMEKRENSLFSQRKLLMIPWIENDCRNQWGNCWISFFLFWGNKKKDCFLSKLNILNIWIFQNQIIELYNQVNSVVWWTMWPFIFFLIKFTINLSRTLISNRLIFFFFCLSLIQH